MDPQPTTGIHKRIRKVLGGQQRICRSLFVSLNQSTETSKILTIMGTACYRNCYTTFQCLSTKMLKCSTLLRSRIDGPS